MPCSCRALLRGRTVDQPTTAPAPIASTERIDELDVLRGFALFGVFTVHFVSSLYYLYPVNEAVFANWTADPFQFGMLVVCDVLFYDKAITLFSVLFGIGFWVQMERLRARGDGFERIYLRRLAILLGFGLINKFLLFPGDILVDYALIGFVLFALRGLSARTMLVLGLLLAVVVSQFAYGLINSPWVSADALDQMLKDAVLSESYGEWVAAFASWHFQDNIIGMGMISLSLFVLGRFLIGAWVARLHLIEKARSNQSLLARMAAICVPIGIACEALTIAIWEDVWDLPEFFDFFFHAIGVPRAGARLCLPGAVDVQRTALALADGPFCAGRTDGADRLYEPRHFDPDLCPSVRDLSQTANQPRNWLAHCGRCISWVLRLLPFLARAIPVWTAGVAVAQPHLWSRPTTQKVSIKRNLIRFRRLTYRPLTLAHSAL